MNRSRRKTIFNITSFVLAPKERKAKIAKDTFIDVLTIYAKDKALPNFFLSAILPSTDGIIG